jgi:hypothetical protein
MRRTTSPNSAAAVIAMNSGYASPPVSVWTASVAGARSEAIASSHRRPRSSWSRRGAGSLRPRIVGSRTAPPMSA